MNDGTGLTQKDNKMHERPKSVIATITNFFTGKDQEEEIYRIMRSTTEEVQSFKDNPLFKYSSKTREMIGLLARRLRSIEATVDSLKEQLDIQERQQKEMWRLINELMHAHNSIVDHIEQKEIEEARSRFREKTNMIEIPEDEIDSFDNDKTEVLL